MTKSQIQAGLVEWLRIAKDQVGMYVTLTDLYMLCIICHRHSDKEPITLSELAEKCGCSTSTASRTIAFLSDANSDSLGLVKQKPHADDRRQKLLALTKKGEQLRDIGTKEVIKAMQNAL